MIVALYRLLSLLPLPWLHRLGAMLGVLVYWLSPRYRRHMQANLLQALGQDGLGLALTVAAETGKQAVEMARIWLRPLDEVRRMVVEVRGWEHVEAARANGTGVLFLTPHLGCFEIISLYLAETAPITALYRKPKRVGLQTLIETGRARGQQKLAPADTSGVRSLIKALRKNEAVGLLPDQAPKTGEGEWIPFFGKPAYTMTLAARLSETQATTIMTWGERLPDGQGYRIHFRPPTEPFNGNTVERAAQINREVENLIRQCPTQYLWGYNRYKIPAGAGLPPTEDAA